jgi:hypothetical protein
MGYLRGLHDRRSHHGQQACNSSRQADGVAGGVTGGVTEAVAKKAVAKKAVAPQAKKNRQGKQQQAKQHEIITPAALAPIHCPDVPKQRNGCDCGVFLLQYVEVAFRVFFDPDFRQIKEGALRSNFTSTWPSFGASAISQKRRYIRAKLCELQIAQAACTSAAVQVQRRAGSKQSGL